VASPPFCCLKSVAFKTAQRYAFDEIALDEQEGEEHGAQHNHGHCHADGQVRRRRTLGHLIGL